VNGFDLDHPLNVDECLRCGFVGFECICDPSRPARQPTAFEIERARQSRLTKSESQEGGCP
jgi:hypothetical protein